MAGRGACYRVTDGKKAGSSETVENYASMQQTLPGKKT